MSVFGKGKNKEKQDSGAFCPSAQLAGLSHPFGQLDRYVPLADCENRLYDAIREAVPVVDAAISKICALTGGFEVHCADKTAQAELDVFVKTVKAGGLALGLDEFVHRYLDTLLMYGTAVGEIIPTAARNGIAAVCTAPLKNVELEKTGPCSAEVYAVSDGERKKVRYPELLLMSSLSAAPGEIKGNSLLKGLPFVTGILLKIYNTIGVNFERIGNVRFAVTYKPASDTQSGAGARERATQLAAEWSKTMRSSQKAPVSDFVAVGDVGIKVIGADNQILDCEVPARLMLEQIVAKTGLPPFVLGLSWSTTERMSSQQADILTSELWRYRRILTPVITKICDTWLRLKGYYERSSVMWDEISLQDSVELAKAQLIKMQAMQIAERLESKPELSFE